MFLSPFDVSLDGLYISIALVSADLIGVGWWGGFSSHIFTPYLWGFWYIPIGLLFFTRYVSKTLYFWRNLEDYTSFLRVPLYIPDVRRFPDKALKLPENFLIVLPTFSKRRLRRCQKTCWLFPLNLDLSVPSDILRDLRSCIRVVWSYDCSSGGVLFVGYCLSLSSLWWQGLRKIWSDWFAPSRGICSLTSFLLVSWKWSSWQDASLLSNGIFGLAVFPRDLWGRRG